MATTFAMTTIQADAFGTFFGDCEFSEGDIEDEIYEFSVPRAEGIGEKSSGNRRAIHTCRITWKSNNEDTVRDRIRRFRREKNVGTLTVESATGSDLSFPYCRLMDVRWGRRAAGVRPDGVTVMVFDAVLIFKQIRIPAA